MIHRKINVEQLESFDFFNDTKDTVLWLQAQGRISEAAILEIAHHRWCDARRIITPKLPADLQAQDKLK